jgi:uncharacterized protein
MTFLALVAVGAAVQSITGFAMALIVMGGVTALGVADISFSAAVVSLISMANAVLALRHSYKSVDLRMWLLMLTGLVPMTVVGVILLTVFSGEYYAWLRTLLGVVIIGAGSLMMAQPRPFSRASPANAAVAVGGLGGLIGGLYGAGGAALAWFMYRQPLDIIVVRSTLLATFFVSTASRSLVVGLSGQLTEEVLIVAGISLPLVILITVLSTRIAPRVPDRLIRRFVFVLLILLGASLIVAVE